MALGGRPSLHLSVQTQFYLVCAAICDMLATKSEVGGWYLTDVGGIPLPITAPWHLCERGSDSAQSTITRAC